MFKIANSDDWHAKIRLGPYRHKPARFCADKETSERWRLLLQSAVDRARSGEPPKPETLKALPPRLLQSFALLPSQTAQRRRGSFADNVGDYIRELETAGRDAKYIRNAKHCLTAVAEACKWNSLRDISRDALMEHLAKRRADNAAPRTVKNIVATVTAFVLWAIEAKRLDANPLGRIRAIDDKSDRRRQRRALTPDEVGRLLKVAGPRELVYRVALGTGLRLRELRRLQWRDVRIDTTTRPRLELRAEATKSRRADTLPLSLDLAARLRAARPVNVAPAATVFRTVTRSPTWIRDVDRAGIEHHDGEVLTVGFHSLRVTFASELERAGVSPRTIAELMRHRDYKLTATVYTDLAVIDTHGAIGRLPTYGEPAGPETARRTGSDDVPVSTDRLDQIHDQIAGVSVQNRSIRCATDGRSECSERLENKGFSRDSKSRKILGAVGFEPT
ncbi:MAG: tyrosine-type recombinase/integrase [Phycisphaerae bacterium]